MPLRLRLGLWYGGLTGLVVILVTLLTYALHTRGHYDDMDHVLVSVTEHVADELDSAMPMPMPMPMTHGADPVAAPNEAGLVLRLYSATGALREASYSSR